MTSILEPFTDDIVRADTTSLTNFPALDFSNLLAFENSIHPASSPNCTIGFSPFSSTNRFNSNTSPTVASDNLYSAVNPLTADPFSTYIQNSTKYSIPNKSFVLQNLKETTVSNQNNQDGTQFYKDTNFQEQNTHFPFYESTPITFNANNVVNESQSLPTLENETSLSSSIDNSTSQSYDASMSTKLPEESTTKARQNQRNYDQKVTSSIDKAAERRRKNRESSSRCYYNRKRIIENFEKQISNEKAKLTDLYDRALELRHENARLKRDVVTKGLNLPVRSLEPSSHDDNNPFQFTGYLDFMKSTYYRSSM